MNSLLCSVLLTTFEDDKRLLQTLAGFSRQRRPAGPWELIVVNDGGSRGTEDLVRRTLVDPQNTGLIGIQYHYLEPATPDFRLAAARNLGLRHCQGYRTIICDCDTVPEGRFVWKHNWGDRLNDVLIGLRRRVALTASESLRDRPVDEAWLQAHVWAEDERTSPGPFQKAYDALPGGTPHIVCWGCNFSASTEAMRGIGGFDEEFVGWGGEDEDMARRLQRIGRQFHRTDAVVYHLDHHPRTSQKASGLLAGKLNAPVVRNKGSLKLEAPKYL